jgi:hypothetical protein
VEQGRQGLAGRAGPATGAPRGHRRLLGSDRPGHPDHHPLGARPARQRQA